MLDRLYYVRALPMATARTTTRGGDSREARIGAGARVRGRIHGDGALVVEGRVEGNVTIQGDLTIAEGASVTGDGVEAGSVTIAGSLEADVVARGVVRLASTARVRGDVKSDGVAMADGARFTGKVDGEFELPPELGGASRADGGRAPARR